MARIARRIAGIGASDLPNAVAFDTYVGPAREITVDPQRGIIALHNGETPGGKQFDGLLNGHPANYFATAEQGAKADTAFQPTERDPNNIGGDVYSAGNHTETADKKVMTAAERRLVRGEVVAIADLSALDTAIYKEASLRHSGPFGFNSGNLSAAVAADTQKAIYVAPDSDPTGASGAWKRQRVFEFNIEDFGARPDDPAAAATNVIALGAAIALASFNGSGAVVAGQGRFYFNAKVIKTLAGPVSIRGKGADVTQFVWTGADGGIDLTYPDAGYWFAGAGSSVEHLSLVTQVANGGTGLRINGRVVSGRPMMATTFFALRIRGDDVNAYWTDTVDVIDASQTSWIDVQSTGSAATPELGRHFHIWSSGAGHDNSQHTFVNCQATYGESAVLSGDYVEGIHIVNCLFVNQGYGVYWDVEGGESQFTITGSHIASRIRCVKLRRVLDSQIGTGNFLILIANNAVAVDMTACGASVIETQTISGTGSGNGCAGIVIEDEGGILASQGMMIKPQIYKRLQWGARLGASTSNVTVQRPFKSVDMATMTQDLGTGNVVEKRQWAVEVVVALGTGTTQDVNIAIPANVFAGKPTAATLTVEGFPIMGFYERSHASTTATSLRFKFRSIDGSAFPGGNVGVFVVAVE